MGGSTVLRRQVSRVRYQPGDRLWLAALSGRARDSVGRVRTVVPVRRRRWAWHIVYGAIGYARELGFEPHADFGRAAGCLGGMGRGVRADLRPGRETDVYLRADPVGQLVDETDSDDRLAIPFAEVFPDAVKDPISTPTRRPHPGQVIAQRLAHPGRLLDRCGSDELDDSRRNRLRQLPGQCPLRRAMGQVIGGAAEWASCRAMSWPSRKYVVLHD